MKKVVILGGGNAGVFSGLFWADKEVELEIIHDPNTSTEPVGQATTVDEPRLLWRLLGLNWYNNPICASPKTGILYEGWGKLNDKSFHHFPAHFNGVHYCPKLLQKYILESNLFKVTEGNIEPDNIDADCIIDCRGRPKDYSQYNKLINPLNSAILGRPNWSVEKSPWSRHVATPDGWTFVIPSLKDSPARDGAVGYLYNSSITEKEDAEKNFLKMFDVEITNHVSFSNYIAKDPTSDGRVFVNGNRLFFLEPMESTATTASLRVNTEIYEYMMGHSSTEIYNHKVLTYIHQLENYILWHYCAGSKYDSPFWDYVKTMEPYDDYLERHIRISNSYSSKDSRDPQYDHEYGQWGTYDTKFWLDAMTKKVDSKAIYSVE